MIFRTDLYLYFIYWKGMMSRKKNLHEKGYTMMWCKNTSCSLCCKWFRRYRAREQNERKMKWSEETTINEDTLYVIYEYGYAKTRIFLKNSLDFDSIFCHFMVWFNLDLTQFYYMTIQSKLLCCPWWYGMCK